MKRYHIIFLLLVLVFSSCEKFLEENPEDIITDVNFYKTAEDAENAVLGMYSASQLNGSYYCLLELHSDFIQGRGSWTAATNWDKVLDPTHIKRIEDFIWNPDYKAINLANTVIENVPQIIMDETKKKNLLGEAYFMRAYQYFELVRGFGSVPLRLTAIKKASEKSAPKASEEDIYKQIVEDLTIAESYLPASVTPVTRRPCQWAAKLLLANVYLTIEDWAKAAAKAEEVINSNQFTLLKVASPNDFYKMFATGTHSEDIMSIHHSETMQDGLIVAFHRANVPVFNNASTGYYTLHPPYPVDNFRNNWDNNDLRKQFNYYSSYVDAQGKLIQMSAPPVLFKKYISNPVGIRSYSRPLLRYTEAFLIYAEAAAMANGNPTALALERLNMIKRRGYGFDPAIISSVDYPGGMNLSDFRNAVIKERSFEFMLENRRWWDLKRIGKVKEAIEAEFPTITFNQYRLLWPIPQSEIDNNPEMDQNDQNPGY